MQQPAVTDMDVFKAQFEQVKKQFAALTATQKMLVFALLAVMGLTLVYCGKYAGSAEMVSLMGGQTLTEAELGNIDDLLAARGIDHVIATGGKMMVPSERKNEALAVLMFNRALPSKTRSAFEEMSKSLTAFSTETERQAVYTQALNKEMASVIADFPGVASATVVISATSEHRIEGAVPPTAMVSIVTKPGDGIPPKKLARAAADGLAGAVSELTPSHVSVIVDGSPMRFADDTSASGGDDDEKRRALQAEKEENVRRLYPNISGLTVVVNFDVDNRTQNIRKREFDQKHSYTTIGSDVTSNTETSNTPVKGGEPGVAPNASGANNPVSISGGGGETPIASSSTVESESITNVDHPATTETTTDIPAGKATAMSAAVGVPLSYFKTVYRSTHPGAKEPTLADLHDLMTSELATIREKVAKAVGVTSLTDLAVDMYFDAPPEVMAPPVPAAPSAAMALLTGHGKELAVGTLAVVSLLLMVMMVRKPSTVTVMTSAGPMTISSLEQAAAGGAGGAVNATPPAPSTFATGGSGTLDAMELGEEEIRTQQMLDQVSTLVKENPDGAAQLVKRWLSRGA